MKTELITILSAYGYPVKLQGSLTQNEAYPESFFTFWNNETSDLRHYDNGAIGYVWDFTVYFYATDPTLVNTVLESAIEDLKTAGWIIGGKGYDVPSDEPTHTGRAVDVLYVERVTSSEDPEEDPGEDPGTDPEDDPEDDENNTQED